MSHAGLAAVAADRHDDPTGDGRGPSDHQRWQGGCSSARCCTPGRWARRWALASAVLGAAVVVATYVDDVLVWRWVETQPVQPTLQDPMDWVTGGLGAVLVVGGLMVAALRR